MLRTPIDEGPGNRTSITATGTTTPTQAPPKRPNPTETRAAADAVTEWAKTSEPEDRMRALGATREHASPFWQS